MDLDDDNISYGLGRKWHRISSQERHGAWRSLIGILSATRNGNLRVQGALSWRWG